MESTATEPNVWRERFDFWVVKCAADRYSTSFEAIMQKKVPARFSEALEIECRARDYKGRGHLPYTPYSIGNSARVVFNTTDLKGD